MDIVNRPSIPDNSKYWKVFEDEMQIKIFLELSREFVNTLILMVKMIIVKIFKMLKKMKKKRLVLKI